jgi:four helix bundle protein
LLNADCLLGFSARRLQSDDVDDVELKGRTKELALRVLKLVNALPATTAGQVIARQIVRSATSVGANYRAACRGRSKAEFVSKLQTVIEESDETCYWLELIIEGRLLSQEQVEALLDESNQITAIMVASRKSATRNL